MLLFISVRPKLPEPFLYISKHRMLLFIGGKITDISDRFIFQNIVCYCLSIFDSSFSSSSLSFQNIVCYCLSLSRTTINCILIDFKTSYVTVYLQVVYSVYASCAYFKTSYVTVYHYSEYVGRKPKEGFQNIVCYCLSRSPFLSG